MDFGVLGTLSATVGGTTVSLGGPVQRRLLASLIARAPDLVSADVLVDDLWGEAAPATAVRTLHSHVARLRRALGQGSAAPIETVENHYRLAIDRSQLDAWRFEDLVRAAAGEDDVPPEQASADLRRALSLWRGAAYADFADAPFAEPEIRRLEALREQAIELAIDCDLARGQGAELIPELEALVVDHPFREGLWSALVVAQYRAGRQGDALATYQRARDVLGDELGIDPGPELRAIEAKVLAQDPSLLAHAASSTRIHPCPWKGLATYQPSDADFFVGRDAAINEVLARLVDYPVVVVTGPSGSGKSSLVRAGVVPALAGGALIGSAEWRIDLVSPDTDPLDTIADELTASPDLLVIDSADELVTGPPSTVREFGELLRHAAAQGVRILMTVRGDLFGHLGETGAAGVRSGSGTVLLGTPGDDDLRRVVEVPAERAGLAVEPALVEAVIADVGGRPGCLPLLSTALVRTWERRDGPRLTLAAYLSSGGATSALERLAEECFGSLSTEEQGAARRLLVRLVINDEGRWRRRRVPLKDAAPAGDVAARAALERLADDRLVSIDGEGVQITHESLTTAWPRLREWLRERALVSALTEHLSVSAHAWQAGGRDDVDLYRGTRLQAAIELEASHPEELGPLERDFIDGGRSAAEKEVATLRRGRRRLGYIAASLVLLLAFAVASGLLAMRARDSAEQAALASDAQRVGLQALGRSDTAQRLLLAVAAVRLHDDPGTRASLLTAIQVSDGPALTVPLAAPGQGLTVSSDGWVAVAEEGGLIEVISPDLTTSLVHNPATRWSEGTPTGQIAWLKGHETLLVGATQPDRVFMMSAANGGLAIVAKDWNPYVFAATLDGDWAASPTSDTTISSVLVDDSSEASAVPVETAPLRMATGPSSGLAAIQHAALQILDPAAGSIRATWPLPTWVAIGVAGDGADAAVVSMDGEAMLIDLDSGQTRRPIPPVQPAPRAVALSDGAELLATAGGADGVLHVWSTADGLERGQFTSGAESISHMAWSSDGQRLMTISPTKATLEVWDPSRFVDLTQPTTSTAPPGSGATTSTAVDPEGRMLAVGTDSGAPWFVDLDTRRVHASSASGHPPIVSIGFFDDGRQVVTTDALGAMSVWDPRTGAKGGDVILGSRSAENPDLGRAVVAPDGRRVATSVDGFGLRIVDAIEGTVGNRAYPDLGASKLIHVLGWTPDGRYVIVTTKAFVSGRNGTTPGPDSWALVDPVSGDVVWATEAPEATVVTDAVFVEDGRTAIVPGQSGQLYSLDTASGRLVDAGSGGTDIVPPGGERRPPKSLSVTEDGQLMAVVSVGSPVEIRNVTSGTPTASLAVSPQTASTHFLSNDELVTVTSSGAVLRFELSADDWLRSACAAAGRELTESEWAQFLPEQPYRSVCGPAGEGA